MEIKYLETDRHYAIPYYARIPDEPQRIIIISHGFGSSKYSPTAQLMLNGLAEAGLGTLAFDFPAHGSSRAGVQALRVKNCMEDVADLETMLTTQYPQAEIGYFSSSFGAFINLLYISTHRHKGDRSFLRSAAVNMPSLFDREMTEAQRTELEETGQLVLDQEPPVTIPAGFLDDMKMYDLFSQYEPDETQIGMVHGDSDEVIEPKIAVAFSAYYEIPAAFIPGGTHHLDGEGMPEHILAMAEEFFRS